MEALDILSDSECVEKLGTDEAIEIWYDLVDEDKITFYDEPTFTIEEMSHIKELHQHIEKTYDEIPTTWKNSEIAFCEPWAKLVMLANKGFQLFQKRGFLDEDKEIT